MQNGALLSATSAMTANIACYLGFTTKSLLKLF